MDGIPWYENYFYGLIFISLVVWGLELLFPWRKNQPIFRKDYWLDAFYMFFNFFIFNLIVFNAVNVLTSTAFERVFPVEKLTLFDIRSLPHWAQLLVFFLVLDFIQWFTHVLLHRYNFLWEFHKVHHSIEEMGFAGHLRYHWMENVFYTPMKYLAVLLIGNFTPEDAFLVYFISLIIGHINHSNLNITYGPFKYILNNPAMHIWHHAYDLPKEHPHGMNYGISLSIWDYIFRTAYVPSSGRDIKLGFPKMKSFPKTFMGQLTWPFCKKK